MRPATRSVCSTADRPALPLLAKRSLRRMVIQSGLNLRPTLARRAMSRSRRDRAVPSMYSAPRHKRGSHAARRCSVGRIRTFFVPTLPAADRYFCTYKRWIVYNASQVYHELQQAVPADVSLESRRHRGCCKGTDCLAPNVTIKKRSMKCASNNVPSRFHTQKEHSCHPVHTEQKNNQHFLRR